MAVDEVVGCTTESELFIPLALAVVDPASVVEDASPVVVPGSACTTRLVVLPTVPATPAALCAGAARTHPESTAPGGLNGLPLRRKTVATTSTAKKEQILVAIAKLQREQLGL
mmetsp:Transcript_135379/g.377127  ORF Transcript_135379/g.377127 Transcript_135379/m.377127 type:complete len:113 (+) Transcript_135379:351-689(+)